MELFQQDVFFEQLVPIRKTGGDYAKLFGIWFLAVIVAAACLVFLGLFFGFILAIGAFYGAYYLARRLTVEYEYTVTNGILDITKIYARSTRKFELSLDLAKAERLEKFTPGRELHGNYKKTVFACDKNAENAYLLVVTEEKKGTRALIFVPDDRLKKVITKGLPKFMAISAFKD